MSSINGYHLENDDGATVLIHTATQMPILAIVPGVGTYRTPLTTVHPDFDFPQTDRLCAIPDVSEHPAALQAVGEALYEIGAVAKAARHAS